MTKQEVVERAYLPWYRRPVKWWQMWGPAPLVVFAIVWHWPLWVAAVVFAACGVSLTVLDSWLARRIRDNCPPPELSRAWMPLADKVRRRAAVPGGHSD